MGGTGVWCMRLKSSVVGLLAVMKSAAVHWTFAIMIVSRGKSRKSSTDDFGSGKSFASTSAGILMCIGFALESGGGDWIGMGLEGEN